MTPLAYTALGRVARRYTRRPDEADDLVQDALLEAVKAGRTDLHDPTTLRWLAGIVRNRARFVARTAGRRRRRESDWLNDRPFAEEGSETVDVGTILDRLAPAQRAVAALALSGHTRREIAYLLRLSDTTLRQRITALRRALSAAGIVLPPGMPGLNLDLAYGTIRDALLPMLRHGGAFASHDPDGHLFIVRRSGLTNRQDAAT